MTFTSVITSTLILIFLTFPAVCSAVHCTFNGNYKSCTYGCCTYDCCTSSHSSSYSSVSNAAKAWVIAVAVVGSLIGLGIVIAIIVCFVKAVKGSSTTVVHPVPAIQPTVTVVSITGSSTMTSHGQWAQPAYVPTPGGVYGPPVSGMATSPPYPYSNPPPAAGTTHSQPFTGDTTSPL